MGSKMVSDYKGCQIIKRLLAYFSMVTVPHKMVGLEECRIIEVLDYRGSNACSLSPNGVIHQKSRQDRIFCFCNILTSILLLSSLYIVIIIISVHHVL